jgi:ribonuclease HI
MDESAPAVSITSSTFSLANRFREYLIRAAKFGLKFDPQKTELMHISINRRPRTDTSIPLPIQSPNSLSLVRPSPQIKILGVIFDPTLSFLPHAQHASSRGLQVLGTLLYLRTEKNGIKPVVARQRALSKILPAMLWASPAWWNGSPYVLSILDRKYLRIARRVAGLPLTTSQSIDRHNGAGWYIQIKANGTWVTKCSNSCYLGRQTEVIDNEAHAVGEALAWVLEQPALPSRIIVCIDNSAVISLLQNNSSRSEFINTAQHYARDLDVRGVKVEARWTPAHLGIDGNEEADQLAKTGSGRTTSPCPVSRTTITYLRRTNRQTLFTKWGAFINRPVNSWKYPDHLAQWDQKNSVTFFRFFCRRTNFDSYFGGPVSQCKCGSAEISSIHLLRDCVSLHDTRSLIFRTWGVLPELG